MQSSIITDPLFIPDEGADRDDHEQEHKKFESIIHDRYAKQVNRGQRFKNTIGVEQGDDDSTVEEKRGEGQKER